MNDKTSDIAQLAQAYSQEILDLELAAIEADCRGNKSQEIADRRAEHADRLKAIAAADRVRGNQ